MRKNLFITSAIMTAVLAVGLSTSTYAWYSTTVGSAVTATSSISAAKNDTVEGGGYQLGDITIKTIANAQKETALPEWTAKATAADHATTYDIEKLLCSSFGNPTTGAGSTASATESAPRPAHWFTAVTVTGQSGTTGDEQSTGTLAVRYEFTVPASDKEVVYGNYTYKIDLTVDETAKSGKTTEIHPFMYKLVSYTGNTAPDDSIASATRITTDDEQTIESNSAIPNSNAGGVDKHYILTLWASGDYVSDENDFDGYTYDISLAVSLVKNAQQSNG